VPIEGLYQSDFTLLHSFYGKLFHDAFIFSMASDCLVRPLKVLSRSRPPGPYRADATFPSPVYMCLMPGAELYQKAVKIK
jgi:hypothetical protein